MKITTFGYKKQHPPEADLILDCRRVPNPFRIGVPDNKLRDKALNHPEAQRLVRVGVEYLTRYPEAHIAVGCGYGRHRSVAVANEILRRIQSPTLTTPNN